MGLNFIYLLKEEEVLDSLFYFHYEILCGGEWYSLSEAFSIVTEILDKVTHYVLFIFLWSRSLR